jgi:AcrR family transcriptional regulator
MDRRVDAAARRSVTKAGRRAGESGTREAIVLAARELFASVGYRRATIRTVASQAGVDPALVMHFYGSKEGLFRAATVMPFDPASIVDEMLGVEREAVGWHLASFLVRAWSDPPTLEVFLARVRAAASEPEAAAVMREQIAGELVAPLARRLGVDRPDLRAGLVSSQLIGFVVARWIVEIDALRKLRQRQAIDLLAPVVQRYLVEPLPSGRRP